MKSSEEAHLSVVSEILAFHDADNYQAICELYKASQDELSSKTKPGIEQVVALCCTAISCEKCGEPDLANEICQQLACVDLDVGSEAGVTIGAMMLERAREEFDSQRHRNGIVRLDGLLMVAAHLPGCEQVSLSAVFLRHELVTAHLDGIEGRWLRTQYAEGQISAWLSLARLVPETKEYAARGIEQMILQKHQSKDDILAAIEWTADKLIWVTLVIAVFGLLFLVGCKWGARAGASAYK